MWYLWNCLYIFIYHNGSKSCVVNIYKLTTLVFFFPPSPTAFPEKHHLIWLIFFWVCFRETKKIEWTLVSNIFKFCIWFIILCILKSFFFFLNLCFYWSIVDIQCCVSYLVYSQVIELYTHTHIYIFFFIMVYHRLLNIVHCYTVGPYSLSILCIIVYIC